MIAETLKIFVTVAEQSNFSRAAKLLNLSQPGVSLHIRNLENEFGARLFHRSPQQVKLTEAGELLYERAKKILSLVDEARERIHLLRDEVTGTLRLGASFTIGEYVLPRVLADYAATFPRVDVEVTIGNTGEIGQGVRGTELDIGLVEGKASHPDLTEQTFMQDEMIVVAPPEHPLCALRTVKPEKLGGQVWVLREKGSGTRDFSDRFISRYALQVERSYVLNSDQGVKEAVAAGLGLAMLSRLVVRKELESGEVCRIPVGNERFFRDFTCLMRKDAAGSLARTKFVEKLHSHALALSADMA
ncbi:LysR family transcriptional regulator [Paenibacillus sp. P26]|nr:LysR family transcriptional regulator [Paenibacillus sp. P26]